MTVFPAAIWDKARYLILNRVYEVVREDIGLYYIVIKDFPKGFGFYKNRFKKYDIDKKLNRVLDG